MNGKDSLYADTEAYAPHCKGFAEQFTTAAHNYTLKGLDALFVALAFLQAYIDAHSIARAEIWQVLANLGLLRLVHYRIHDIISLQTRSGGASKQRTISNNTAI
jgi:hypothetical protein